MITFKDFNMAPQMLQVLDSLGFTEPTEIQKKALPALLTHDKVDCHGQAQTGTGKTLAFGIPLLHKIDPSVKTTQGLIVAPTRELALQIRDSLRPLAAALNISIEPVYGGMSMEEQVRALKRGVQIVVGTPGRLHDHLRRKTLQLDKIKTLVLDEADIMLDMGFKEEVEELITYTPRDREIWLFSATVKSGISDLMRKHMRNPISLQTSKQQVTGTMTKQYFCVLAGRGRITALSRFIESTNDFYGFIFCQTKILTADVAEQLIKRGYSVGALHGDMSQAQRNIVIKKFRQKELSILVATDVAARGIDIANLTHVINYSLPEDQESYIHRIGRTGRAGKEGIAITFLTRTEVRVLQQIQRKFSLTIDPIDVPSYKMLVKARLAQAGSYFEKIMQGEKSAHADELEKLIGSYTPETLRSLVASLAHDKFLSSLEADDKHAAPAQPNGPLLADSNVKELYLPLGSDDGLTKDDISNYLTKTGHLATEHIYKIRVIKRRTFIEVPHDRVAPLCDALRNKTLAGRKVRIGIIDNAEAESSSRGRSDQRTYRSKSY